MKHQSPDSVVLSWEDWFWREDIWLPGNSTWADLKNPSPTGLTFPELHDLFQYALSGGALLLCIRFIFEWTISKPFGKWLGLTERKKKEMYIPNPILEAAFWKNKAKKGVLGGKELRLLSKQTGLETRQIERWLRKRAIMLKPTTLNKFSESAWRTVMYLTTSIVGIYTLWDKEWVQDFTACFRDYPMHDLTPEIWFHYMLSASLYCSLMVSQFYDCQRKDFKEMFIHHVVTLLLIFFSWGANLVRLGTSILVVHDLADIVLELAKMANYTNKQSLANTCFACFTLVWFCTRLYLFPVHILRSINFDAPRMIPISPVFQFLNGMLVVLFGIQLFWTYYIVRMLIRAAKQGGTVEKDDRSSSEETISSSSEDDQDKNQTDKKED